MEISSKKPSPVQTSFDQKGDTAQFNTITEKRIKTLAQLIELAEVDTKVWEVERFTCNKWEVAGINRDTNKFITQDLWQVKATFKKRVDAMMIRELTDIMVKELKSASPRVPKLKFERYSDPCLAEVDIFDMHFGKLTWGKETGEDFDLKIAKKRFMDALADMIGKLKPYNIERILFPIGNDYFNSNSSTGATYGGTPQSEDDRWKKTFAEGWRILYDAVNILAQIAPVDVIVIPGNHDVEPAFYAGEILWACFAGNPNVRVDNSPPMRKYYRYGNNLIGFTHGKDEKITELPLIMASEASKDFSETKYREWHLGDKHHKKEYHFLSTNEIKGVTVRLLRSLTSTDNWHYQKGYIGAIKAAECFVWNKQQGLICNLSVNI